MKIAIISDIHANLLAFDAVLAHAVRQGVTQYLCLGDVVGYGPQPQGCVEKLRFLKFPTVLGNHDKLATMNPGEGSTIPGIDFARKQLTIDNTSWLRKLLLVIKMPGFAITHASFHALGEWECINNANSAAQSFSCLPGALGFFGHTHFQRIWRASDMQWIAPSAGQPYQLTTGERYLINPGSVGDPRLDVVRWTPSCGQVGYGF